MPKRREPKRDPYQLTTSVTTLAESLRLNLANFAIALIDQVTGIIYQLEEQVQTQKKQIESQGTQLQELVRKEQEREARERSNGTPDGTRQD